MVMLVFLAFVELEQSTSSHVSQSVSHPSLLSRRICNHLHQSLQRPMHDRSWHGMTMAGLRHHHAAEVSGDDRLQCRHSHT